MSHRLIITGFQYQNASSHLKQGVKGHFPPARAVAGGNGSYIIADPPQIWVDLQDVDTCETRRIDMYRAFKEQLSAVNLRMSQRRAVDIVSYYRSLEPFQTEYWDVWPEIPDLAAILH